MYKPIFSGHRGLLESLSSHSAHSPASLQQVPLTCFKLIPLSLFPKPHIPPALPKKIFTKKRHKLNES